MEFEKIRPNFALLENDQATLEKIVRKYPIPRGIAEIVAYLSTASASLKHIVDADTAVGIKWEESDAIKGVRMPG